MTEPTLAFDHLGFAYRTGQWVLRHCGGMVQPGQAFAVLGPNGCGKSTLLKLLMGTLRPQEGTVRRRGAFAFVPQLFQVSFDYSVLDMVLMGRARQVGLFSLPSPTDEQAAMASLERLGIADLAQRPFHQLSGGQRQLVVLARALVSEAALLFLDEPTSALDLKNQALILDWIDRFCREDGLTVLFTTHQPQHAWAVADTTLLMQAGREGLCGPTREVMTEARLGDLYGVDMRLLSFEHRGRMEQALLPVLSLGSSTRCPEEHPGKGALP